MKKKGQITAFYIETLILILVVIGILLMLTRVLGLSRQQSVQARRLTEAVTIAQSVAEASSHCASLETFPLTLERASWDSASAGNETYSGVYLWQEGEGGRAASYRISVERSRADDMAEDLISIYPGEGGKAIYTLVIRHREEGA